MNSSNLLKTTEIQFTVEIVSMISGLYLPNRYPLRCVQVSSVYAGQFRCTVVETVCTDQDNDLLRAFRDIDTFYCSIFNGFRFTEKQVPMTHHCNLKNYD